MYQMIKLNHYVQVEHNFLHDDKTYPKVSHDVDVERSVYKTNKHTQKWAIQLTLGVLCTQRLNIPKSEPLSWRWAFFVHDN